MTLLLSYYSSMKFVQTLFLQYTRRYLHCPNAFGHVARPEQANGFNIHCENGYLNCRVFEFSQFHANTFGDYKLLATEAHRMPCNNCRFCQGFSFPGNIHEPHCLYFWLKNFASRNYSWEKSVNDLLPLCKTNCLQPFGKNIKHSKNKWLGNQIDRNI